MKKNNNRRNPNRVHEDRVGQEQINTALLEREREQVASELYWEGKLDEWDKHPQLFESGQHLWEIVESMIPGAGDLQIFAQEYGMTPGESADQVICSIVQQLNSSES